MRRALLVVHEWVGLVSATFLIVIAVFSMAMLLLAFSRLVLWRPRRILPIGSPASWKRANFNLHNVLGFYSSLVMLAITLSGVLMSGRVLLVENTRTAPLGTRILNLKRSAHTGDIFGAPTQALYFLVSLGIAGQAITGTFIWWNGRTPSRRRQGRETPARASTVADADAIASK